MNYCSHDKFTPTCPSCQQSRTGKAKAEITEGDKIYELAERFERIHSEQGWVGVAREVCSFKK